MSTAALVAIAAGAAAIVVAVAAGRKSRDGKDDGPAIDAEGRVDHDGDGGGDSGGDGGGD